MISKIFRAIYNFFRILGIRIRLGSKVSIPFIQPMRVRSQLMIQRGIRSVKIGKRLKLETDSKIRVIEGGSLTIGDNCFMNCGAYMTVLGTTAIGDNCLIGPNVLIFDHDHDYRAEGGVNSGKTVTGEIIIGNNVWIGGNSTILRGARIGDGAVIAAGSIVKGEVPAGSLYVQKRHTDIICKTK